MHQADKRLVPGTGDMGHIQENPSNRSLGTIGEKVEEREVFQLIRQDSDRTKAVDESLKSVVDTTRCGASSFQPNSETDQPPQSYSSLLELQEADEEIEYGRLYLLELVVRKSLGESLTNEEPEVLDNFEALSQAGQGDIKHTGRPRRTSTIVTC
jgi:hypothetical protein